MKKWLNGQIVAVDQEDIRRMEEMSQIKIEVKMTAEERLSAVEEQLAATKILLGVE